MTVAVWLVVTAAPVAVNAAELDPADTVTDGGTDRLVLLLASEIIAEAAAVEVRLAVQVQVELEAATHPRLLNAAVGEGATREIAAVFATLL